MTLVEAALTDTQHLFPTQCAIIQDVKKRAKLSVEFARLLERLKIEGKSFRCLTTGKQKPGTKF